MKTFAKILVLLSVVIFGKIVHSMIYSGYEYEKSYSNHWELADKSSTIPTKQKHVATFLERLEDGYKQGEFATHNAIFLKTDNNSFEKNIEALRTLTERLKEIEGMNPSSFEYNTAIQQITQQEQGEAGEMLGVFSGCFYLKNHKFIWGWIFPVASGGAFLVGFVGLVMWANENDFF